MNNPDLPEPDLDVPDNTKWSPGMDPNTESSPVAIIRVDRRPERIGQVGLHIPGHSVTYMSPEAAEELGLALRAAAQRATHDKENLNTDPHDGTKESPNQ